MRSCSNALLSPAVSPVREVHPYTRAPPLYTRSPVQFSTGSTGSLAAVTTTGSLATVLSPSYNYSSPPGGREPRGGDSTSLATNSTTHAFTTSYLVDQGEMEVEVEGGDWTASHSRSGGVGFLPLYDHAQRDVSARSLSRANRQLLFNESDSDEDLKQWALTRSPGGRSRGGGDSRETGGRRRSSDTTSTSPRRTPLTAEDYCLYHPAHHPLSSAQNRATPQPYNTSPTLSSASTSPPTTASRSTGNTTTTTTTSTISATIMLSCQPSAMEVLELSGSEVFDTTSDEGTEGNRTYLVPGGADDMENRVEEVE